MPELVRSQVEEQLGDSEQPPVIDYVLGQFSEASGGEALAFALDDAEWSNLQDQAKESGMKLMAVSRGSILLMAFVSSVWENIVSFLAFFSR